MGEKLVGTPGSFMFCPLSSVCTSSQSVLFQEAHGVSSQKKSIQCPEGLRESGGHSSLQALRDVLPGPDHDY